MTDPLQILSYWRNSLADASLLGMGGKELAEEGKAATVFQSVFRQGQLKREYVQGSLKKELKEMRDGIILAPLVMVPTVTHGRKRKDAQIVPFWIPASVKQDGKLSPMKHGDPWIPRELLEPIEQSRDLPILGALDDYDHFITHRPPPLEGTWADLWAWSQELFQSVTGQTIEAFALEGYEVKQTPKGSDPQAYLLALEGSLSGPGASLVRCYDRLKDHGDIPKLFSQLGSMAPGEQRPLLEGEAFLTATRIHLGQMSGGRSLTISQRESLVHFLNLGSGQALAVNGPPGTGKTTLLHSVIASLVVSHAVEGGNPPLILATSTSKTSPGKAGGF